MATVNDRTAAPPALIASCLPVALPLTALAGVWLTVAGHTMNFREMDAARGWITAEGYSLHSFLLIFIALSLLLGPALSQWLSARTATLLGLAALVAGSIINGTLLHASLPILVAGRALAGGGIGQVLFAAPRLLPQGRGPAFDWFAILLPALGPLAIAGASILYGWSSWEGGFLFEGALGLFGLACIIAMPPTADAPSDPHASLTYWPCLAIAAVTLWYILHWGHLSGWFEDGRVILTACAGVVGAIAVLWLAWPRLDLPLVCEGGPRLVLIAYAGMVQFFNVSEMGSYGGLLINLSAWQRACLIWSVSVGTAMALVVGRVFFPRVSPGRMGTIGGLLALTVGMILAYRTTLAWPFWNILNTVEFNWFAAPQHWELAPARLLMGFGTGWVLLWETRRTSNDPKREARIRPVVQAVQFLGGAIGIGFLATGLLLGHQLEYAYATDRGYLQPVEVSERQAQVQEAYTATGASDGARKAEVIMQRSVNYQADNLVFADFYGFFAVTSLVLAAMVATAMVWHRLRGEMWN